MNKIRRLYDKAGLFITRLYVEEKGASGIEYALIAAMVAVIIAVFVDPVNAQIRSVLNDILEALGGTAQT
ncbi:Flp family type IVb pilin [Pokkaliibacter sp. CJK22405]|uniref:Flp family type IVb pilin n=1 Tax=Pokkaliibacter sp. CJK22405 TaxID=3384615 RepID=UPI003985205D